jgi:hypothetical protein
MGFDELKNKAKDLIGEHGDKVDQGVERAGQFADDKTGGTHSEHIDKGEDKLKEGLRNFGDQQ